MVVGARVQPDARGLPGESRLDGVVEQRPTVTVSDKLRHQAQGADLDPSRPTDSIPTYTTERILERCCLDPQNTPTLLRLRSLRGHE
jgi:hypothetical protein